MSESKETPSKPQLQQQRSGPYPSGWVWEKPREGEQGKQENTQAAQQQQQQIQM